MEKYDVIIIGAGPAGIFCALELCNKGNLKVLVLEKGKDLSRRVCPSRNIGEHCTQCSPCDLLFGVGGAGAFSDGKLTLTTEIGGHLADILGRDRAQQLIDYTDSLYLKFGAPTKVYGTEDDEVRALQQKAALAQLILVPTPLRHLGTEKSVDVLLAIQNFMKEKVEFKTLSPAQEILVKDGKAVGVTAENGETYYGDYIVAAPGRQGASWLQSQTRKLNLSMEVNPVDLGVRVEVKAATALPLTEKLYESKCIFYSKKFDDPIRTFCMCPYGEVSTEYSDGIITVNGHSYAEKKTDNTNFALLVSKNFTHPFKDPIAYGEYIARLANLLADGVIVQRLGDLQMGRRSTPSRIEKSIVKPTLKDAVPGDLSLVLPYRHLSNIMEMLSALDCLAPGIASTHTLLYGVEVKFYSSKPAVNQVLETQVQNLFVAGDGAGITRGLMQASAAGILVAEEILKRSC